MSDLTLCFIDNPSLKGRESRYKVVRVKTDGVLKSWRASLFSFEWLDQDGNILSVDNLPLHYRDKRLTIERSIQDRQLLQRPVLGIGLLDHVEIGAGKEIFMTLAAQGVNEMEVHIPASSTSEFSAYIVG